MSTRQVCTEKDVSGSNHSFLGTHRAELAGLQMPLNARGMKGAKARQASNHTAHFEVIQTDGTGSLNFLKPQEILLRVDDLPNGQLLNQAFAQSNNDVTRVQGKELFI